MRKKGLFLLFGASAALIFASATVRYSNGTATDYTDSPVDGTGDCSGCHRGGTATPVIKITAVPAFGAGTTYVPNTTYTISYNVTGYPYFGLDLEMVSTKTTTTTDGGKFGTAVANCKITAPSSPYPTNVTHTKAIATASSASWKWTAPASGPVYLYTCCIGANGDGNTSGDKALAYTMTINPSPLGVTNNEPSKVDLNIFPNPANSEIHLRYTLEKRSVVSVKIFDLSGKMVADLQNETLEAGEQNFDSSVPSSLSKGLYTVNLSIDGMQTIKKLVIR